MSLTTLLRSDTKVRQVLKEICPSKTDFVTNSGFPAFSNNCPIVVPPNYESPLQATIIGTASDYLFRFQTAKILSYSKEDVIKDTNAERGLNYLIKNSNEALKSKCLSFFNNGISIIRHYIYGDPVDIKILAEISFRLANFEYIYRNGKPPISFEEELDKIDEKAVHDLINLAKQFELNFINSGIICSNSDVVFNPSFGKWSSLCGGADADIYIDGVLYDFKCTKDMYKDWYEIGQLFGYYCLYLLSSMDKDDKLPCMKKPIHTIAVYKSRYGIINRCVLKNSSADYSADALKRFRAAIEYENNRQNEATNNQFKAFKTVLDKMSTMTTTSRPRNLPLNTFVYNIGTRIYGGPYIGKGTIINLYQSDIGGLIAIKLDSGQTIKDRLITIFKKDCWILFEKEKVKEGSTVLDLEGRIGKVIKIIPNGTIEEIVIDYRNIGKRTLNLQQQELVVVRRATPVFQSAEDFPYKKGDIVLYKNQPATILGVEFQLDDNYVIVKNQEGLVEQIKLSLASIDLEDEFFRNDMYLRYLNGKTAIISEQMKVGDTIQYTYKTSHLRPINNHIETIEGIVIEIHQNDKGIYFATIDFGDKGIIKFAGGRLHFLKNQNKENEM